MMTILDGKKLKNKILDEVKEEVSKLSRKPKLVVIQIGNDEASLVYIKQKEKMACYVGYLFEYIKIDDNTLEEDIIKLISRLNDDPFVDGITIELPIPKKYDYIKIINSISSLKDIDGITNINMGLLVQDKSVFLPCTPFGIMMLLDEYNISVKGKKVVIVGKSLIVGKPLSLILMNAGATVTICNSNTRDLEKYIKNAEILVVSVGKSNFITNDMLGNPEVIIDVGINLVDGKIVGDIVCDITSDVKYITPVPGGVGPMTVAALALNVLKAYRER